MRSFCRTQNKASQQGLQNSKYSHTGSGGHCNLAKNLQPFQLVEHPLSRELVPSSPTYHLVLSFKMEASTAVYPCSGPPSLEGTMPPSPSGVVVAFPSHHLGFKNSSKTKQSKTIKACLHWWTLCWFSSGSWNSNRNCSSGYAFYRFLTILFTHKLRYLLEAIIVRLFKNGFDRFICIFIYSKKKTPV